LRDGYSGEDAVGDSSGFARWANVVDAENVGSGEDCGGIGGGGRLLQCAHRFS
jgi:hypothetical protein